MAQKNKGNPSRVCDSNRMA